MSIYGAAASGISKVQPVMRARVADNYVAIEEHTENPAKMFSRMSQNNSYLEMANEVMNLILRSVTALQP